MLKRNTQLLQFRFYEVDYASVEQLLVIRMNFNKILLVEKVQKPH